MPVVWDPREPPPPELVGEFEIPYPIQPHSIDFQHYYPDLVIKEPERNILPPFSVSLTARIVQDTAKVTVNQLFWNSNSTPIHMGSYTFTLPAGCTVTDFSCRVGRNRIVRAKVKPKQEARDAYDHAVRRNQTAGLLEQDTPEIFTTTLGNIPANVRLKAEISYVTLLKHRFGDGRSSTTLTIPTYIAARYGNSPPGVQNATPSGSLQSLSIKIEVVTAETVQEISSSTHNITVERGIGNRQFENWPDFEAAIGANDLQTSLVKLEEGSTCLDKDFVLDIATQQQDGLEAPHAWLEVHPSFENHKAVMLTIPPNLMLQNESSSEDAEIMFLADRSGSMGKKMESLKSAMAFFLNGIPLGRKFNIWCFGSSHVALWNSSQDYSDQTLDAALEYVKRNFCADLGGTELLGALKKIVNVRDQSRMTDIVVLTDGEVWKLDETIDFVQQTRRETEGKVRFFALGVGNAVSHELVEGISKAGGGYAEVIPAASQGRWEDRVVAVLRAALKGHIGPLRIEFDDDSEGRAPDEHFYNGTASPDIFLKFVLIKASLFRYCWPQTTTFSPVSS
jgi:Vault protein inter-alpha-trypsin domain/von Willebrand factor type A domain